jgi:Cof subfamily protein (haloacid dehalogenase superfamily)
MKTVPLRLIAFDLDGTLLGSGENQVHPVVADAIRRTTARGLVITLATGRPYSFSQPVAVGLGLTAPLICYQGGIVQGMDGRLLRDISFSQETLAPALALARRNRWQVYLERDGTLYLESGIPYDETLFTLMSSPIKLERDLALADLAPNQFGVYLPSGVTEAQVRDLQAAIGPAATVMRTHPRVINAFPAGVSKGAALAWLADHLGVPQSAVMAVGDSDNDASMVSWAGIGVAMGGARASVLEVADWVAPTLEQHGVAAALERFVLSGDGR